MSKDRNTFAKRQREVQKKQKADQKRARRAQRGQNAGDASEESGVSISSLSPAECSVLSVFRKCLMTPEKVLSFDSSNLEAFKIPLARLAGKGLIVEQSTPGTYSLTDTGFVAMKDGE